MVWISSKTTPQRIFPMTIPFLTAHWRKLVVATFAAPDDLLDGYLQPGVELDRHGGQAFCSLVGFQFLKPSLFGMPSPFFRNFPEWNLRIYVRRGEKRGVHFVREFVPHRLVTWAGRLSFREPFETAPVTVDVSTDAAKLKVKYTVTRGDKAHVLSAEGAIRTHCPSDFDARFTNLNWAFSHAGSGGTKGFEVKRPAWDVHPLQRFEIDVDWVKLYGPQWATMIGREPVSVALVGGSEVRVTVPKVCDLNSSYLHSPGRLQAA